MRRGVGILLHFSQPRPDTVPIAVLWVCTEPDQLDY